MFWSLEGLEEGVVGEEEGVEGLVVEEWVEELLPLPHHHLPMRSSLTELS